MRVLFTVVALLSIALLIHLVLWRLRLPKGQIRALLCIFGAVLFAWFVAFATGSLPMIETLQIALCYVSISLSYVITYSAIEGDSPTLSLMRLLAARQPAGMDSGEVAEFLAKRPFVKARISALIASGQVREEGGRYVIAGKPSAFFRVILAYRKLYGPISRGG
jgi:hypothetical protein